jgi:glycosyltransferase involved in cell wall biosynthesis
MTERRSRHPEVPFFSICIPQYNRTDFLLMSLRSYEEQTFQGFEVCISDGASTDGGTEKLLGFLRQSNLDYSFFGSATNLQYDPNLRSALSLSRGEYCLLMGNDDMLGNTKTLETLREKIVENGMPAVVVPNYRQYPDGEISRRIRTTRLAGAGPRVAANSFRHYSFVSGLVLSRAGCEEHRTVAWDGSEMYQMYLATRIVANGGALLELTDALVLKDIQIPGQVVDSYARRPVLKPCPIVERLIPLVKVAKLVVDALKGSCSKSALDRLGRSVYTQFYGFTYAYWIIEYRRVQSWRYALGICHGMRPRNTLASGELGWLTRIYSWCLYALVTAAGLITPILLFSKWRRSLHAIAKRWR